MIRPEIESDGYISSNNDDSNDDVVLSSDSESGWSDKFWWISTDDNYNPTTYSTANASKKQQVSKLY